MARFGVNTNIGQVLERNSLRLAKLSATASERVVSRTVATVRRRLATATRRFVAEDYGIGVRELGRRITTEAGKKHVSVYGTSGEVPLIAFGGRYAGRRSKGATASIRRGIRKTYVSAFLSADRKNIVARAFNRKTGKRYGRLPVRVLRGPSVESMVLGGGTPATASTPAGKSADLVREVFASEIDRLLTIEERG